MLAFLASSARRLVGLAVLVGLLAGLPYALATHIGWPLPHHVPTWQEIATTLASPLTDQMLGNTLVCLLWAAWAAFAWSVLAESAAALAGIRLPQPRALAPARGLATLLIAMITGGVLASTAQAASTSFTTPAQASPTTTLAAPAVNSHHPAAQPAVAAAREVVVAPSVTIETESRAAVPAGQLTLVAAGREYVHTVKRGDTLSEIAQLWLGDANRWPEIFALNRGTHFPDVGGALTNPHLIYPGWTLELPDDAVPPGAHQPDPAGPAAAPPGLGQPCAQTPPEPPTATGPAAPATPTRPGLAPTTPAPPSPSATVTTAIPDDDDGVVVAVPTGPAASAAGSGPATASRDPAGSPTAERRSPDGVALPSGSWVDLGLAGAIAAAVALVWAHRRHRYTRRPPSAQLRLDDPDLAPAPRVVTQIRRGLRWPTPQPPAATTGRGALDADARPDAIDVSDFEEDVDDNTATVDDDEYGVGQADDGDRPCAVPVVPALANPTSAVWPPAGLGLTGPGAEAAARGFLTAALAAGGLDDPDTRTWVVMPSATAATLLGTAAVRLPDTPRLTVTAGLDEALELLETQTLHRTRLVYRHEVDDVAALRAADPFEEPLPPLMLLADTTGRHERTRIAALLAQGQRLDIHGVLLGPWPVGDTVVVAEDGTTSPAAGDTPRHGSHPADIGRLTVLDPAETADLLTTLAESHTGRAQAPAPAEPTPGDTADPPPATTPDATAPAAATGTSAKPATNAQHDVPPAPATATPNPPAADHDAAGLPANDGIHACGHDPSVPGGERPAPTAGQVDVTVLGRPQIVGADPHRSLRAKSLELLVYLAVHDGAASSEAILDDLLPDAPSSKATHRLHTYVSDLRTVLRHTGGPGSYITHPDQRYVLNPDRIDIDLWRMRAAIREADTAPDRQARIMALRRAVDTSCRPLADGCDYEWIEPYREGARQQALDACLALAAELDDQPTEQLTVLETAIGHNPYAEPLYQAAMRAHAQLGHLDAIRALRRTLTRRLAEIDAEPGNDSITLADRLVSQLQRPGRDTPSRRASGPGDEAAA